MSNTSPSGAQAPAGFDPAFTGTSAPLRPIDQLRECVARGLCLIPNHTTLLDYPEPGMAECGCGKPDCKADPGKHPRIKWTNVTAPPSVGEVEHWEATTHPWPVTSNWAVLLGSSEPPLAVLDIDTRSGGLESFAALVGTHGPLPHTWRDESSRGGGHYYFAAPPGLPEKAHIKVGPGLDFLAGRHLVIIEPSTHWTGTKYRWQVAPWAAPLAELPPFLRDLAIAGTGPKRKAAGGTAGPTTRRTPDRARQTGTPPAAALTADEAEVVRQALACVPDWPPSVQGQNGSGACYAAACRITQGFGLRGAAAWAVMSAYNRQRCQPIWSDAELAHKLEDAAKGPVTGKLLGVDWAAIRDEVSGFTPADIAHLLADDLDEPAASPPPDPDSAPPDADPEDDGPDDGGAPPLPPPAPDHPLADPAAAARVIRDAAHPDPDVVAKAAAWASAHAAGPGVYLDRDPPADAAAVVRETLTRTRVMRSLTVLQAGKDCADAAESIASGGPAAAAYPIRTPETCKNLKEVHRAERLGLAPTAAVCPDCPHNIDRYRSLDLTPAEVAAGIAALPRLTAGEPGGGDDLPWHPPLRPPIALDPPPTSSPTTAADVTHLQCPHLRALDAAKNAPHRIATSTRTAFNFHDVTADAEVVILLDNAEDVLVPHAATGPLRPRDLDRLARAATWAARKCRENHKPAEWWDALRATADAVGAALAGGVSVTIPPSPAALAPRLWPRTLWRAWAALRDAVTRMPDQLVAVCAAAASGELRSLAFAPDAPAAGIPTGRLSATWFPRLPPDATVIALADAPHDLLGRAVGKTIIDITLRVPPGWAARAVQVPELVTGGSRERGVAARVRGHLAAHPGERLAVLLPGNRKHFEALREAVEDLLVPAEQNRVTFAGWYDRGVPACDRVLALGVPAIPPWSVSRRLEQRDLVPAALADGDWGEVRWHGVRGDGTAQEVVGRGYRHPDWAVVYRDAVLDLLRRKLVRVAVPVTVVADLNLELPLADADFAIDGDDLRLLEALRDAACATDPASVIPARSKRGSKKKGFLAELTVSRTGQLVAAVGVSESTAKRRLTALAGAGLVTRVGARGGWTWPGPIAYPDYGPGEGTDAADASTPAASGDSAPGDRPVPELAVAVSDPGPADAPTPEPATDPVTETVEPQATADVGATTEPESPAEASWDPDLLSLVAWFLAAEQGFSHVPFRLPRPGRPGGFVIAEDPPALYARVWAQIEAGPGAARSNGLARTLRELYAVFGGTGPRSGSEPPNGVAA